MESLFDVDCSSDPDDCDYEPHSNELVSDVEEPLPFADDEKITSYKSLKGKKSSVSSKKSCEVSNGSKIISHTIEENKKADDVYKSFLDEVAAELKDSKIESMSSNVPCSESYTSSPIGLNNDKNSCQSSTGNMPKKLTDLAKKTVTVNYVGVSNSEIACSSESKGKQNISSITLATPVIYNKRKSLDSILGNVLYKRQKMTVLTKSMLDWKIFKEEEGIEEELSSHNRGKGGFIEKKKFLERSDIRTFEIQRDIRLAKRQPKRNL